MLKLGDHGPAVLQLQENLLKLGKPLPRWGADGHLGTETLGAVARVLSDHGAADPDPSFVTETELGYIDRLARLAGTITLPPKQLADLRPLADREEDRGPRPWSAVTGVCLHQTACVLGEKPERWRTLGAHIGITRGGKAFWLHDLNRVVWHGNHWNASTIGIEFDGTYPGIAGRADTLWQPAGEKGKREMMEPTSAMVDAGKLVIRWIAAELRRHNSKLTRIVAHRQASELRRSDPGSALWQAIALPLHRELGINDGGLGLRLGDGLPIPTAWDPRCIGVAY